MITLEADQLVTVVIEGNQGATGDAHVIVRDASCAQIADMGSEVPATASFGLDDNNHFITSCGGAGGEAVFTWTAPVSGNYSFWTDKAPDSLVLALIDGDCPGEVLVCDGGTASLGAPASIVRWVEAGEQITILGDGDSGEGATVFIDAVP